MILCIYMYVLLTVHIYTDTVQKTLAHGEVVENYEAPFRACTYIHTYMYE